MWPGSLSTDQVSSGWGREDPRFDDLASTVGIIGQWTMGPPINTGILIQRANGDVYHYITQLLAAHGGFRAYQHRFRLDVAERAQLVQGPEDAHHIFFYCPRFGHWRPELQTLLVRQISPNNLINLM